MSEQGRRLQDDPQCVPGSGIQAMRIEYFPDTDSLYIDLRRIPFGAEQVAG